MSLLLKPMLCFSTFDSDRNARYGYKVIHNDDLFVVVVPSSLIHVWTLWPCELQHMRLSCPLSPRVWSNSCPLSQWFHPTISSSVVPFSPSHQSFLASGSFPVRVRLLFSSSCQSSGASASTSVLPMIIQHWLPLGLAVFFLFYWKLIILQYYGGFCHTLTWISHGYTCVPHLETPSHLPPYPIPQGHPSAPALSTLSHTLNLDWQSISYMIIYIFQCYSLRSSHPCLLPQNPKVFTFVSLLLSHI